MHNATLAELSAKLARKEVSSVEVTRYFLERVAAGKALNAFITVDEEKSLAQARAADERIAKGGAHPLTGIPIAHKDLFCAKGWRTTCASKILENFIAPYDAHVIEQFNAAGAVILGKTNMDEFAMGSSNENSYFGPVKNPWDTKAVPGGSSGGSAAAVAARMAPAATGTDTGGSIPHLAAIEEYKKQGATVVEVSLPNQHLSVPVYYVLAPAEASSNLSRYDGVRYGYRAPEYTDLLDMYKKTRAQGFGPEVKRRILIGTYVLSHGYYDAYYLKAQQIRRLIARDFAAAFGQCDLIMGPAAPCVAYDIGAKITDCVQMYLDDLYTIPINLAGLPGMSIPCGFGNKGRPVGLQIVGNYWSEALMLSAAHAFQQVTDWHTRTPPAFA